jgi:predicted DNA-binding antitoxin AbrB/MazE fold protein
VKSPGGLLMYAIKAIYDGCNFKPMQPIPVKEDYEVVITFIEPLKKDTAQITSEKKSRAELIGILKDKVWMSDDFNEPLDEMKEYM